MKISAAVIRFDVLLKMRFNKTVSGYSLRCLTSFVKTKTDLPKGFQNEITNAYNPEEVEKDWYEWWEKNGYLKPQNRHGNEERFSVILPPPNITGKLHLGHTLTIAIQDSIVRWQRMLGREVVWIPGTDHAGIATQAVVEKWLQQNKKTSRHDLGREKFLQEVWKWREEKGNRITHQLRKIGASLDWSRETFTMDAGQSYAVKEAIVNLWKAGLMYRTDGLVNWSCQMQSAISDIEVDHKEILGPTEVSVPGYQKPVRFGQLVDFAYKVCNSENEIVVSTTRIETMLGDVAVAVHPEDSQYIHLHGASVWHPFRNVAIPIICDASVDPNFGTGAVKVTPAHSMVDLNIAKHHSLPALSVISQQGTMNDKCGKFTGMRRFEARDALICELTNLGLMRGIRPHSMQLPVCSRSGDIVEFLIKPQWYVRCKDMAERAADAVRTGQLEIEPIVFHKTWYNWLDNIKDWCISRQLWWGHQLPMYEAKVGDKSCWVAAHTLQDAVAKGTVILGKDPDSVNQDCDVLDTWFSSALFPFSGLGWPNQTDAFQKYYPLNLMETGHDIIFFWVARMTMLGLQLTGQLPFKKILLHGIVCDAGGRKMSKSLGNVINPEDVISGISLDDLKKQVYEAHGAGLISASEVDKAVSNQQKLFPKGIPECGVDALRFTLLSHNIKNHFINFDVNECLSNRHFCNKIWQACKYTLSWASKLEQESCSLHVLPSGPSDVPINRWILSRLDHFVNRANENLSTANFHSVMNAIKQFLYYDFCDVYLELTKPILQSGSCEQMQSTCRTLLYCLDVALRVTAPFMPYVCEELYQRFPGNCGQSVMIAQYPQNLQWRDRVLEEEFQLFLDVVSAVRQLKAIGGFYQKIMPISIKSDKDDILNQYKQSIELLSRCSLSVVSRTLPLPKTPTLSDTIHGHTIVHLQIEQGADYNDYIKRTTKKEKILNKELNRLLHMTSGNGYKEKVPLEAQKIHTEKVEALQTQIKHLQKYLSEVLKPSS